MSAGCGCAEAHAETGDSRADAFSLYLRVDRARVTCLNEAQEGSGAHVLKPWEARACQQRWVDSDADEELLFNIPFTGDVRLKSVVIVGGGDGAHPAEMKLFKNRPCMTFDDTAAEPDQSFELTEDFKGEIEYPTKVARFSSVQHLSVFFPSNFGAEQTRVYFIGLKGDFTAARRHEVTITNYEARANPADHKTDLWNQSGHQVS